MLSAMCEHALLGCESFLVEVVGMSDVVHPTVFNLAVGLAEKGIRRPSTHITKPPSVAKAWLYIVP